MHRVLLLGIAGVAIAACGSRGDAGDAGAPIGDGAPVLLDAGSLDDGAVIDVQAPLDASKPQTAAGYPICDGGGVLAADRFATKVVQFAPGDCAGFGAAQLPSIVLGPPVGSG